MVDGVIMLEVVVVIVVGVLDVFRLWLVSMKVSSSMRLSMVLVMWVF